ncbi:unnamed protein product [Malus baccata var. baccata]
MESTELYIERTNQGFQIQALNCEKSYDDQEEIGAETKESPASYSRLREETTYANPEILPKSTATQESTGIDVLERDVHTNSKSGKLNCQLLDTYKADDY